MVAEETTVKAWGRTEALAYAAEVFEVYDAVFGDHPNKASWQEELYERHCAREGFRLSVAMRDLRLVGFAWGYVGQRGQYWPDKVIQALPPHVADSWVGGHFEFVELAVLPDARRQGLGSRLHDVLLDDAVPERALLSTDNTDSPAVRLYTARGWRKLGELSPETQVMGLHLRNPTANG
ncbi:MAG: GNAT family N-acetyltransferase [Nocardioidaceae bacterium]